MKLYKYAFGEMVQQSFAQAKNTHACPRSPADELTVGLSSCQLKNNFQTLGERETALSIRIKCYQRCIGMLVNLQKGHKCSRPRLGDIFVAKAGTIHANLIMGAYAAHAACPSISTQIDLRVCGGQRETQVRDGCTMKFERKENSGNRNIHELITLC